jgi:hypothetical protein
LYAPIFVKSPGSEFKAYHGRTTQQHKVLYKEFTKNQDFVPVNISVVYLNGRRYYTALYDKRKVGKAYARTTLTFPEYQKLVTKKAKQGYQLIYINSYIRKGLFNMIAIWYQNQTEPSVKDNLDSQAFEALLKTQRSNNLYLRAVTGFSVIGQPIFSAIWNK